MAWSEVLPGILVMALTTYLIRAVPLALFTRKITSRRLRAFLYYVPYAVLSAMTIPGVFTSSAPWPCAAAGMAAAAALAWQDRGLLVVSLGAAAAALAVLLAF